MMGFYKTHRAVILAKVIAISITETYPFAPIDSSAMYNYQDLLCQMRQSGV